MKKLFLIILSGALLVGCDPKIDEYSTSKGSADFSRYIAVGNSVIAGFADGALYHTGQSYSTPNIIAKQLQLTGSGAFIQPVVTSEYGVLPGKLKLGYPVDCLGETSLGPVHDNGNLDPIQPIGYVVNNLGIPGAKTYHLLSPGYGNPAGLITNPPTANPYYVRFATNPDNMVVQEIIPLNATFFTLWLGTDDLLSYATSGGAADSITHDDVFAYALNTVIETLVANGAKGVMGNIPDITSFPFFTTIPYNGLVLTQEQADQINQAMKYVYHMPFDNYVAGPNPFLIPDPASSLPFKVRQMLPGEMVLLTVPQDSLKCGGWGIISPHLLVPMPIPGQFVLTQDEITKIQTAVTGYNQIMQSLAMTNHIGLVDMYTKFNEITDKGIIWDGVTMTVKFVSGGTFSLDGIHLTPRGNALAANYFIEAINGEYGSKIPFVSITDYPGVTFP